MPHAAAIRPTSLSSRAASARRHPLALVALLLVAAAAVIAVLAGCSASTPAPTTSAGALPTGVQGAAHFSDGYISVGSGSKKLDEYIDPMCPYCGQFERTNGAAIATAVDGGSITLRIHPMNFLDSGSQGTRYSSRAVAALACVAVQKPAATLDFLAALYANQPKENSTGLTNARLDALATKAGASSITSCITGTNYQAWASWLTAKAIKGPIPGSKLKNIQGTPTVLVDGAQYNGSITDASAFQNFLTGS